MHKKDSPQWMAKFVKDKIKLKRIAWIKYKRSLHSVDYSTYVGMNVLLQLGKTTRIKTHDSESRGQEEAGRTRRTSELFTRSTALKFINALNKPP